MGKLKDLKNKYEGYNKLVDDISKSIDSSTPQTTKDLFTAVFQSLAEFSKKIKEFDKLNT